MMTSANCPYGLPSDRSELAFLELAEPDISSALKKLHQQGVCKVILVPILLFSAGHAQEDIPTAVKEVSEKIGITICFQCPALESHPEILELSAERFQQAISKSTGLGITPERIGLAMIGRGSSSSSATESMHNFTAQRQRILPLGWSTTGFVHAQRPNVLETLDLLERSNHELLVVQPHLLFEGQLMEDLRAEVQLRQSKNSDQQWLITEPLGCDIRVATALCQQSQDYSCPATICCRFN